MTDTPNQDIANRRARILAELAAAHDPAPELIAVSKSQSDEAIDAMLAAGQRVFGENRVQEAEKHWETRKDKYPGLTLHLIGPLQTNKAAEAVRLFDVIQTLDREKLADSLATAMEKEGRRPKLFIQVNTGEEEQKAGVSPSKVGDLLRYSREQARLEIVGLMCIPPVDEPAGPHFALLRKIAKDYGLPGLSMGMSGDYELAARYGATHVRVGTALFGSRD
ncbi:YggS family pyridoxal phosphate-dependent enzyme [Hyphomonas sp. WL0036]|uniref:YggS family pyridoxal phosphate-dependent enzyme n=1 Tax=Hyphomonas sediminis TaxID=2866160 RepID=UPI001C7EF164|nr:YggS family pyridoxal phosphate-dependent enzyme [Hyphomonas sediminis]MBY9065920.1 YggS family pyridoxal phosphate-dependent enzyme [Hyphomonas sediminis]